MIKAVFFDWSNTVARYVPSREELQSKALGEIGISISPRQIAPGIALADRFLIEEGSVSPISQRSREEQAKIFASYEQMVFRNSGISITDPDAFRKFMMRLGQIYTSLEFVLYDDVLPNLKTLKQRGLALALVTNVDANMDAIGRDTGLSDYLDFILTSGEVGAAKPNPKIFLAALERAGASSTETVHVGDQYDIDVVGARNAGIRPILLDRQDMFPDVTDCPRIHTLDELGRYLE